MSQSLPPPFTPDSEFALDTPRGTNHLSITALARFEFEAGKANDGTKILMIEWSDEDLPRSSTAPGGSWHVSWEGKQSVLPADERTTENTRRVYFLLPPHTTIPPVVTLFYSPPPPSTASVSDPPSKPDTTLQLNPLPAIFPPELGATGRAAGKKGVLHTIWAKKRLQVLDKEIHAECLNNVEGIALHMALQEKEWIESNFGLGPDAASRSTVQNQHDTNYPMGPATPVSPSGGGKLGEKLKGLKLQTGERELSPKNEDQSTAPAHFLSPQSPDMAVSSFKSFHNMAQPTPPSKPDEPVKTVAHYPPESLQEQMLQSQGTSGFSSMGGMARTSSADSGEELFAKALSPRTPDLPRSPFSFASEAMHM
ncbi:hypothetical protein FE257_005434 [Aspergillus nanangensis]|uniref:Uncharacterized protein n=1 Tax=Aspergillus nanangensis TaxID=2582783 RepID=A0AAD4CR31_ASPNN|nr:hypothetical protein FE257_005434 [Aspergillus nanangensis]